ncbi:MAG: YeeE/YedE family protein [Verrucomicrobiales bacterium]|nr:YeeE/YedE family protein [Verrucomicrobiales bacterium]
MKLPITGDALVGWAIPMGMIFGALLHRGAVTRYDVIVNQFRLRDFTVMKVMLTAIVVGGAGVLVLHGADLAAYHIKPANLLAVIAGGLLFGIGMVLYGYCPGTGIAAVATGAVDALVGVLGMLVGGMLYGLTYPWVRDHIETVWAMGKKRLPEVISLPDWAWMGGLAVVAVGFFLLLERKSASSQSASEG